MKFFKKVLLLALLFCSTMQASESLVLNFNKTDIQDVITFVAKETHTNILMTGRINGKVTFMSEKPIEKKALIPLLIQILQAKGYTLVDNGHGYYTVTRASNAKKLSKPDDKSEAGMVTKILHTHFIKASMAVQKLRYLGSQFASISHDDKKKIIIMTDYPDNIANFSKTLVKLDRPLERSIRFVTLTHADAVSAQKEIGAIFKAMAESFHFPITLQADAKSNKLVLIGDERDLKKAIEIIQSYDAHNTTRTIVSDVIFLNNAEAVATVKILNGLMKSFDKQTKSHIAIQAKEDINAIALTGTPQAVAVMTKVIKKLDIEQQQVYVKAHIYEISQRKMQNLGIKWGATGGGIAGNALMTGQLNMGGDVFTLPSILQGAIDLKNIDANMALGIVIDLLKQNGAVNVVSEPNILCLNNKKSSVYIGKTISILTSQATGSDTTSLTRNTYSREDIGLTLEVKPQIASDNKVLMEVKTKLEDIDQSSTTVSDRPTTFKREVQTVAIVQDGQNVIIGGLLKDYYSKGETRVPLLGDLPLFGPLFRSKNDIKDQINVIIVLTPYIIKNSDSLNDIQKRIAQSEELKARLADVLGKKLIQKGAIEKEHAKKDPVDVLGH